LGSLSSTIPSFEFGKRKRWADLVITELVDVLPLVLSPLGKVLYCGNGLKGLLGWNEEDLIDYDFADLLNAEDKDSFMDVFESSLRTGNEMKAAYVRMRCAPSSLSDPPISEELIFEISAADDPTAPIQVVLLIAKPYPTKAVSLLDTYIDLQNEHERLQHRVAELRARAPRPSALSSPETSPASSATSMYATTSMVPKRPVRSHSPQSLAPSPNTPADVSPSPAEHQDAPPKAEADDRDEDPLKKKKPSTKKAQLAEQHVCITCGRTDSPEWRKGPLGPKTLCNACGLRWAKQTKVQIKAAEEDMFSPVDAP
ncbi:white collar 2 type of transcription factor, partial [Mycena rebaudengoi]